MSDADHCRTVSESGYLDTEDVPEQEENWPQSADSSSTVLCRA